jgi:alpha/beta superfamily hydrolase
MVLVGSSMGGHVSAAAARRLRARGLFLLAPAFYMPGFEAYTPQDIDCPTAIVHGWRDDIVPVENSIRWAREHKAELHILESDHRLQDQIETICVLLRDFLGALN